MDKSYFSLDNKKGYITGLIGSAIFTGIGLFVYGAGLYDNPEKIDWLLTSVGGLGVLGGTGNVLLMNHVHRMSLELERDISGIVQICTGKMREVDVEVVE